MKYYIKSRSNLLLNEVVVSMKTEKAVMKNDRGVSEIIGVILIFGILVLFLGILQSMSVPQWNKQIEAAHFNTIYDDVLDMRQIIQETAIFNLSRTAVIHASLDYPTRMFLYNPLKPGMTISLMKDKQIQIYNGTYLPRLDSCTIRIRENYNYFLAPELIIEHGMIIGSEGDHPYLIDGPPMNNKTMDLYLVDCSDNSIGTTSSMNIQFIPVKSDVPVNNVSNIAFNTSYPKNWIAYLNSINIDSTGSNEDTGEIYMNFNNITLRLFITNIKI
ncbi:MAG: hypothetical protein OIN87_07450 [Candidatus Methanoperedens sp.]|nr:hypothetical protein [Candidatus Methanoperedens sp.]